MVSAMHGRPSECLVLGEARGVDGVSVGGCEVTTSLGRLKSRTRSHDHWFAQSVRTKSENSGFAFPNVYTISICETHRVLESWGLSLDCRVEGTARNA